MDSRSARSIRTRVGAITGGPPGATQIGGTKARHFGDVDACVRRIESLLEGNGSAVVCDGEDVAICVGRSIRRDGAVRSRSAVEDNGRWFPQGLDNTLDSPVDAEIPGVIGRIARNAANLRTLQPQ